MQAPWFSRLLCSEWKCQNVLLEEMEMEIGVEEKRYDFFS